jgi:hypothetical protein
MILSAWLMDRWNRRVLNVMVFICAIVLPPLTTLWILPRFIPADTRETARLVRANFGEGPFCFYGPNASIPLCFNLRQSIPLADTPDEFARAIEAHPDVVIITIGKEKRPASAPAREMFEQVYSMKREDQVWDFYRRRANVTRAP